MGKFRKKVHSETSRSARIVINRYLKEKGITKSRDEINLLVKEAESAIVPVLMEEIRSGKRPSS
jgi:hypothetical protein